MRSPIDPFTSAVELAAAIRRKEVSPVEVADCYLKRMDELDPRLNAFCHRADDDVRKAASAATDAVGQADTTEDLPPFHGVPLPIKDLVDVAGWPTTHGSAGASQAPAAESDPVVQRFVDAGFVLLGKTTTSEFGTVPFTESEALGISRSPWDPHRSPGGSSSGAGVAVAAGMAPIAHAEDGGGSIRVPASCNGLVGLKPTRGLITNAAIDLEGLATSGVLTRSVADTAAGLNVLARHDPAAWWSPPTPPKSFASAMTMAPPTGLRIGVFADSPIDGICVDPACAAAVDIALQTLESVGHHVVDTPLPLPPPNQLIAAFTTIWNVGGAGITLADPNRVEPHNRVLRDAARAIDSWAYAESVRKPNSCPGASSKASSPASTSSSPPRWRASRHPLAPCEQPPTTIPSWRCSPATRWPCSRRCSTSPANRRSPSLSITTTPPACPSASRSSRHHGGKTSYYIWLALLSLHTPGPIAAPLSAEWRADFAPTRFPTVRAPTEVPLQF